jgi:hypothetical protein
MGLGVWIEDFHNVAMKNQYRAGDSFKEDTH